MLRRTESDVSKTIAAFEIHSQSSISLPPPSLKGHQRSRTNIEPPLLYTRERFQASPSPSRLSVFGATSPISRGTSPHPWGSSSSVTTDLSVPETQRKAKAGAVSKIASWFEGSSDPVEIKLVPSQKTENSEPFYLLDRIEEFAHNSMTSMDNFTQRPKKPDSQNSASANSSRFSFFRRNSVVPTKVDPDELVQLDVREALLPEGPVEVTPATFRSLQLNAESLVRRYQSSYADNLGALRTLTAENNTQADELEAERIRSEHFRAQLQEMAERTADQETVIAILKAQLSELQPTVRMIEDEEQYTPRKHNRRNRVSDCLSSNDSFVDSEMSSAVSVFSEADSVHTRATSVAASPRVRHAKMHNPMVMPSPEIQPRWQTTPILVDKCQTCINGPTAEAWEVVDIMRMENAGLKERITELESANDEALSFLSTLKI